MEDEDYERYLPQEEERGRSEEDSLSLHSLIKQKYQSRIAFWELASSFSAIGATFCLSLSVFTFFRLIGASIFSTVLFACISIMGAIAICFLGDQMDSTDMGKVLLFGCSAAFGLLFAEGRNLWDWVQFYQQQIVISVSLGAIAMLVFSVSIAVLKSKLKPP